MSLLMSYMANSFISCRRSHLDANLEQIKNELSGAVLDVGGRQVNRRGAFSPPLEAVRSWTILNPDLTANPDVCGALPHLPFPNETFDQLLCTEVLEYVAEPDLAIRDMARVLAPNGVLYLSLPFLHVLHGDAESDRMRFTITYARQMSETYFSHVDIYPMGGLASVIFDLVWQRMRRYALLRPLLRLLGPCVVRIGRPAIDITTGFFVIARKPKVHAVLDPEQELDIQ